MLMNPADGLISLTSAANAVGSPGKLCRKSGKAKSSKFRRFIKLIYVSIYVTLKVKVNDQLSSGSELTFSGEFIHFLIINLIAL